MGGRGEGVPLPGPVETNGAVRTRVRAAGKALEGMTVDRVDRRSAHYACGTGSRNSAATRSGSL